VIKTATTQIRVIIIPLLLWNKQPRWGVPVRSNSQ